MAVRKHPLILDCGGKKAYFVFHFRSAGITVMVATAQLG